jgi:hypothetical protein
VPERLRPREIMRVAGDFAGVLRFAGGLLARGFGLGDGAGLRRAELAVLFAGTHARASIPKVRPAAKISKKMTTVLRARLLIDPPYDWFVYACAGQRLSQPRRKPIAKASTR